MPSIHYGDNMAKKRTRFDPEFKVDSAHSVLDQGYSVREAFEAMGVSVFTLNI